MASAQVPDDVAARSAPGASPLVGRQEDRRALDDLLAAVRGGAGAALVVSGEPGIGKTTLLEHVADSAAEMQITSTAGVESETGLGFAALHRLLVPYLDRVGGLPPPQRDALRVTFGLVAGPPPDRFLVGLATLTLLADAAAEQPLICLVDDAQWLDPETLAVLGFVGRRLGVDGVGLLFAVRDEPAVPAALDGLARHHVAGLPRVEARELFASLVAGRLDERVAARVVAETGGNPLALIELAGELTAEQLAGQASLPESLPVGRLLEEVFLRCARALPGETQSLLLIAAAGPAHAAALWNAARLLGLPARAADPAVAGGLLSLRPRVDFRHPLIRSAVYAGASGDDRRRVHQALAAVMDAEQDRDRRAWHLAAAAVGPDEDVAAELERCAERARSRGGYSAQAAFLVRAAELTPGDEDRAGRLFAAAQAHLVAGDPMAAQVLLDQATPGLTQPVLRVHAQRLRAAIEGYFARVAAVPTILLGAVAAVDPSQERLARDMLFDALGAALLAREHMVDTTLLDVARAAHAAPAQPGGEPTVPDLLLDAFATRIVEGYAPAVPLLRSAVRALGSDDALFESGMPLAVLGTLATDDLWDDRGRNVLLGRLARFDREHGALAALWVTLVCQAGSELWAGSFARAEALHAEADEMTAAIGFPYQGSAYRVELLAWQGREAEARAAAQVAMREWGEQGGLESMSIITRLALTSLELSLGRYAEALAWALPVYAGDSPSFGNRVLGDLVEAGVRSGDRDAAEAALARLAERAPVSGTPWALGLLARGRALLTDGDAADAFYRESIDHLGATSVATDLARSHLLYGEWLRRRRRPADARVQLRIAHDAFVTMGAAGFAERARIELRASGERARRRSAQPSTALTPQEAQIARRAAQGETNAEIAGLLFISVSTVEYHLVKIFRKLAVSSRRQLADALRDQPARGHETSR